MNYNNDVLIDFSSCLDNLPIAVFIVDDQGHFHIYNQNWLNASGYNAEEIRSINVLDIFGKIYSEKFTGMMASIFSDNKAQEIIVPIIHTKNKHSTYYKILGNLYQEKKAIFYAIDISEEMRLRDTLLNKKKQFLSIINSLGDVVFKLDRKGNYKNIWTPDVSKLFDKQIDFEGKALTDHFPEDVVKLFLVTIDRSISTHHMVNMEFLNFYNGTEKWFLAKIAPIHVKDAESVEEVTVIIREITEERKNRHQIEYKNRIINQLTTINNGPILHVIEGESLNFSFISGNVSFLTGYTPQELDERKWWEIIFENDRDYVEKNIQEVITYNKDTYRDLIYRIVTKDGNINWVTNHISKSKDDGNDMIFGVMLNVTEIQLLNYKLKQRDRILTNSGRVAMIGGWEYDLKYNQTHMTDEIYDIYEVNKDDFKVLESVNYYIGDHATLLQQHLDDLLKYGKGFDLELKILTGKGNIKWVRIVGCAEWYQGRIAFVYGILQDINEKKGNHLILQESERRFNAAFELAPLGIGLVSPDGKWIKVNLALSHFFEFTEEELKKISLGELKLYEECKEALNLAKKSKKNKSDIYQMEKEFHTKNGMVKWGRFNVNPVKDKVGHPLYFIFQIVDITENKEFEKKLMGAKKEAEEAAKAKSDFLSTMSHEIRTPLNGVIGITNLLLGEIKDAHQREQLIALKFSSDSLLFIVNDILDFSKIKSNALSLELKPFGLKRLVESVRDSNIQKSHELGNQVFIHFDYDLPLKLIGDELRIGQILNNLVNNAIKFTKNGTINLSIKKIREKDGWYTLLFSIKDSGIGIPESMQSAIFEQFTQAESGTTRKYGGTGLGLSIVKGLLKRMNSDIKLASKIGQGTEVTFELTLRAAKGGKRSRVLEPSEKLNDLQNKTILLVEDNLVSMMVAGDYIKKWKGEVIMAENGLVAVEKFLENKDKIGLVLMDLQMPIMNGFQATQEIKKIKPDMAVIALTASIGDKSRFESFDYGMVAYVIKPFLPDALFQIIKKYIQ